MDAEASLWERSRRAAYAEISGIAMRLFLDQGFEQTTIDQIAAAAGISRRSFFRYFGTKEDVL
ncbi:helix-turn-helix domain-containing protein, partial [Acinetobacter baumannii]